ncbi:hypothetical protein VPH35_035200 [Triticum aestivum]
MNVVQRASPRSMSGGLEQASPIPCQNPVSRNVRTPHLLDEMHPSPTAIGPSGPRRPAGETAADHLSALPDDLLRRIMSSLRAWEVVRTCVLARRWRHLWASAPCLDFRPRRSTRDREPLRPCDFFYRLFLFRNASAPVDTLRLWSSDALGDFAGDAGTWIRAAIRRGARVIHVVGRRGSPAQFAGVPFISCHLRVLKLSYARLDRKILEELSSRCTSLEELDLKDCLVATDEIPSASLKALIMLKCKIECDFSIAAPNLVLLRLVTPYLRVPSFKNLGSLYDETNDDDDDDDDDVNYVSEHTIDQEDSDETTTTDDDDDDDDAADDNRNYGSEHIIEQEDCDETTSDDGTNEDDEYDDNSYVSEQIIDQEDYDCDETNDDDGDDNDKREKSYKTGDGSFLSGVDSLYICEDDVFTENTDEEDGSDNSKNSKTGYGEIIDGEYVGGRNILWSISNVTSLGLLTDAGECMAAGFVALIFLLQHSPIIQRLFLQLKLVCVTCIFIVGVFMPEHMLNNNFVDLHKNFDIRSKKALETSIKLQRRSFNCKDLEMVKIKWSKDDMRVHKLANQFIANGVPLDKILVHRSGSACESYRIPSLHIPFIFTCNTSITYSSYMFPCYFLTDAR